MARKLDSLPQAQREKIETDLLAISVIYNERYGIASTQAVDWPPESPDSWNHLS